MEIGKDEEGLFFTFAEKCHKIFLAFQIRNRLAVHKGVFVERVFAQGDQCFIIREDGVFIMDLRCGIYPCIIWVYFKPWGTIGETGIWLVRPLHWCAGVIPAVAQDCF